VCTRTKFVQHSLDNRIASQTQMIAFIFARHFGEMKEEGKEGNETKRDEKGS